MLYVLYLLVFGALLCLDQLFKYLIISNFDLNDSLEVIKEFFSITYIRNYGAGFSILQNQKLFLSIIAIVAVIILAYLLIKTNKNDVLYRIAYLLVISGSLGNLIDRLRLGYVIDFLDFNFFGYGFPIFNGADCYITIGCFLIIFMIIKEMKDAKN